MQQHALARVFPDDAGRGRGRKGAQPLLHARGKVGGGNRNLKCSHGNTTAVQRRKAADYSEGERAIVVETRGGGNEPKDSIWIHGGGSRP